MPWRGMARHRCRDPDLGEKEAQSTESGLAEQSSPSSSFLSRLATARRPPRQQDVIEPKLLRLGCIGLWGRIAPSNRRLAYLGSANQMVVGANCRLDLFLDFDSWIGRK